SRALGRVGAKLLDAPRAEARCLSHFLDRKLAETRPYERGPRVSAAIAVLAPNLIVGMDKTGLRLFEQVRLLADVRQRPHRDQLAVEQPAGLARARVAIRVGRLRFCMDPVALKHVPIGLDTSNSLAAPSVRRDAIGNAVVQVAPPHLAPL